ncbi:MAG: transposase, partial [Candidatus Aminicenantes bacterium]|nr:transposase [Candidatus Aminicenantes bacterium]
MRLAEVFGREVLAFLVGRELLSPEWAERLLSWRHTGFSVHSRVRAKTKTEAERVGKYMIRPVLSLERLSFLEPEGKVSYRYGQDGAEQEMKVVAFITNYPAVDRIIDHLKLTFVAEKPPPSHVF